MPAAQSTDLGKVAIALAIGYGVVKIAGVLDDDDRDQPGGEVTPGTGDQRPATITTQDALSYAQQINTALYGNWGPFQRPWEYDADAGRILMQMQVTNDVYLLMNAYGDSGGTVLHHMTLSEVIAELLDANVKAAVNSDYELKGITVRWA